MAAVPTTGPLTVFGLPAQTETARVLTCLFEKQINFKLVRRDTYKATDEHHVITEPTGQVVVVEGDKTLVSGSRDICRHLCQQHPTSGNKLLLGAGDLERVEIEKWIYKESQFFDPPSTALVLQLAFNPAVHKPTDRGEVDENMDKLRELLVEYNDQLSESKYLAGDTFSLADLFHLPNTEYLFTKPRGYQLITEKQHVNRWWRLISGRESWQKVKELQKQHPGAV